MKKTYYIVFILLLAIICSKLTEIIYYNCYYIKEDIIETIDFRHFKINDSVLKKAKDIANKRNYDFAKIITINYLEDSNLKIIADKKLNQEEKQYIVFSNKEFQKVYKAFSAILNDLKFFPVAKNKSNNKWIAYEDSFFTDRNYNGVYKHEGCDIMAKYNVSGYYPIISVTDGTVENIGWLPKGGYRVGIRGNHGGYFYYAHLSSYSNIKKGDYIKAGTLLGYMGDTGYGEEGTKGKFDVHLHFGIYISTDNYEELSINPYYILKYLENHALYADY